MSRSTRRLVLPLLFTLGCSLAGGPAGAAPRSAPRAVTVHSSGGWLAQFLMRLSFALGKSGIHVDPNGGSDPGKNGYSVDPNGNPNPNKSGFHIDPNGGGSPKP